RSWGSPWRVQSRGPRRDRCVRGRVGACGWHRCCVPCAERQPFQRVQTSFTTPSDGKVQIGQRITPGAVRFGTNHRAGCAAFRLLRQRLSGPDIRHAPRRGDIPGLASTMYRLLAANGEVRERRDQLRRPNDTKPELLATKPNELWSWDITKLFAPTEVDVLPPLRHPRRLQPLRCRLDGGATRVRGFGREAHRRDA